MNDRVLRVLCGSVVALLATGTDGRAWIQRVTSHANGSGTAAAADATGNVVTVGRDPEGLRVARFDGPTGASIWSVNPTGEGGGTLEDLALAANGDVIAAGRVPPDADHGWALRLAAATGAQVWRFDLVSAGIDAIYAVTVDGAGDVLLAAVTNEGVSPTFTVVKLDGGSGAQLWRHDETSGTPGVGARDVAVTPNDDVIAVGLVSDERFVIRLDGTSGSEEWRFTEDPPATAATSVAVDATGDVVVGGTDVIKLDGASGTQLWRVATAGLRVVVDGTGDVIASDGFDTAKLDGASGGVLWSRSIFPAAEQIHVTSADDVVLSGRGYLFRWSGATGTSIWSLTLGVPVLAVTTGPYVALDPSDHIALAAPIPPDVDDPFTTEYAAGSISDRLSGRVLLVRDSGSPTEQRLIVKSKDKRIVAGGAGGFGDPTIGGATLVLANPATLESVTYTLPASGWEVRPASGLAGAAYQYRNPDGLLGPCRSASIRGGKKLTVTCRTTTPTFTLDEATQGGLVVRLTAGNGIAGEQFRYCLAFPAGSVLDDRPGLFKAKDATPPADCLP